MPLRILLLAALACAANFCLAQEPDPGNKNSIPATLQATVDSNYGDGFTLDPKYQPLTGDFDADGTQDLALVAITKSPLANSVEKSFRVIDPYDAYFGFGDPRVTTKFSDFGDGTSHCVLIIHDWKNANPKTKFLVVNLPFEKLELVKLPYKKKTLVAISATELGGLNAVVFWDGKKWKWEPSDFSNDLSDLKTK